MKSMRTLILLPVVAVILWLGLVILPGQRCEQAAQMLNVNYSFSPVNGCFIQQPSGSWMRIDQPLNNYQP